MKFLLCWKITKNFKVSILTNKNTGKNLFEYDALQYDRYYEDVYSDEYYDNDSDDELID